MRERYGFAESEWAEGKAEMLEILKAQARRRGMITYGDLSRALKSIAIGPHESAMFAMLGEISGDEDLQGRGMLSAVVVHKLGDMEPGDGFYVCAADLGRDTSDRVQCWIKELHKVHNYWANRSGR